MKITFTLEESLMLILKVCYNNNKLMKINTFKASEEKFLIYQMIDYKKVLACIFSHILFLFNLLRQLIEIFHKNKVLK
jgi:hypothetical protein